MQGTRRFVRRQRSWFRRDPATTWLDAARPDLVEAARQRVSAPPERDVNVQWRIKANEAVYKQIREQPLVGVGFGRTSEFFLDVETSPGGYTVPVAQEIGQDPHNGYLYLWSGGGLVALGSFLTILTAFAVDVIRRFRRNDDPTARIILLWTSALLFVFLFNAASGTSFENPGNLLTIWTLLLLPAVVTQTPKKGAPR